MTDKEKKALREAFDFPEPDRKDEFIAEFAKLCDNKDKKPLFPFFMRFAAAAAMLTLIIGVLVNMPKDTLDFGNGSSVIVQSTEAPSETEGAVITNVTVTAAKAVSTTVTTVKTTSSAAATAKNVTTVKAVTTAKAETTAKNSDSAPTTSAAPTSAKAQEIITTVTTTAKKENSAESAQTMTTTESTKESADIRGRNMTVCPDIIYKVRDKTIPEEALYAMTETGPSVLKPSGDGSSYSVLMQMYNDSSAVILANVDEMLYTFIDGEIFTAEQLSVHSVIKGSLIPSDKISVYFEGGYMPAEMYLESHSDAQLDDPEEYSVYVHGSSINRQDIGSEYLFFINNGAENIPEGAYSPVSSGNISVFRKVRDIYVSLDKPDLVLSEDELRELR